MNGDLKQAFILKVLTEYGQNSREAMQRSMKRMKVGKTGQGFDSIAYQALQQGAGGSVKISFNEYLRMVDMGAGRAHPLGGLTTMSVSLAAQQKTGDVQIKDRVRRPKKFYSKTMYGLLGWMYNKLLYGYTEETIDMLKKEMQQHGINQAQPQ